MYKFMELMSGPSWRVIARDFVRRAQGEAFARDWLRDRGFAVVDLEHDNVLDGVDIMSERRGELSQFVVERCREEG